jgi:hypothetical protein
MLYFIGGLLMKETFDHSFSPEVQDLIFEINRDTLARESQRISQALELADELDATLIGFWGHATGNGGREYPIFRSNTEDTHFRVTGRNSQELPIIIPIDINNTPNGLPVELI